MIDQIDLVKVWTNVWNVSTEHALKRKTKLMYCLGSSYSKIWWELWGVHWPYVADEWPASLTVVAT